MTEQKEMTGIRTTTATMATTETAAPRLALYDQGLKELLRRDAAAALSKASGLVSEMKLKYTPSKGAEATPRIDLVELQKDAQLASWISKCLIFFALDHVSQLELAPCVDRMVAIVKDKDDSLLKDQVLAQLLYVKQSIVIGNDCSTGQLSDEILALQKKHPDDFLIAKCHVKSLAMYATFEDNALMYFEQFELKPILDEARAANKALIEKHGYTKITHILDMFELSLVNYYLTTDEFGRMSRRYLTRQTASHLQIKTRLLLIQRLDTVSEIEAKDRHYRQIGDLLENEKYKQVRHGEFLYHRYLRQMLDQAEQRDDGAEAMKIFKKLEGLTKKLYPAKEAEQRLELNMIILAKRFPEEAKEAGIIEADLKSLNDHFRTLMEPYVEADVAIPGQMKAEIFSSWFRSKNSDREVAQASAELEQMIELTKIVVSASKMGEFQPTEKNDLASIMIGAFNLVVKCSILSENPEMITEKESPEIYIKKLFDGFEWCTKLPAEEFRVETMNLYLELLIGLGVGGPQTIGLIEVCQEKVVALYKKKDILPYLTLQNQKAEFLVNTYLQSYEALQQMAEVTQKEEQKASEAILLMTAIVGNSKNIKMVQHYLLLAAIRGMKRDKSGAMSALTSANEILDSVKVNRNLYKMQFSAALLLEHIFGLADAETQIKRADQALKIFECESNLAFEESRRQEYSIENMVSLQEILNIQITNLFQSGMLEEAIAVIREALIPLHNTMKQVSVDKGEQFLITLYLAGDNKSLLQIFLRKNNIEEAMVVSNTLDAIVADALKMTETAEMRQSVATCRDSFAELQKNAKRKYRKIQREKVKQVVKQVSVGVVVVGVVSLLGYALLKRRNQ